jgi:hypothetical protein
MIETRSIMSLQARLPQATDDEVAYASFNCASHMMRQQPKCFTC